MIFDAENTFLWNEAYSADSKVIANGNGGVANNALWLVAKADSALGAETTVTLKTSDDESMSSPATLTTLSLAQEAGSMAAVKLPLGLKKYMKVEVSGASSGNISVFLAMDVDIAKYQKADA